ncbi:glycosyltransferase [Paenibacillus filicis]|uniref:Glycosyltransferase n=2 Tax=Paenibacillus gyeongsangnamensis TaxID=3388067 RepID=A0ABT4QI82_9BACL|nr:glycosyltransferase [Paenibacillus filicis]MCZ8516400.1 glycosyltransferase [Paenibacillus filicis]
MDINQTLPFVSIIIPAKNEGTYVESTVASAMESKSGYPFEIVIVDDDSADGCCDFIASHEESARIRLIRTKGIGAAKARNLGAGVSKGKYLIFCDAHLSFEDLWIDRLLKPIEAGIADGICPAIANMDSPNITGYGQTLDQRLQVQWNGRQEAPFPCAILPGGCFAISRDVFFDIGGFDEGFKTWGYEDVELSLKMWLFGYKCSTLPDVKILHLFRESHPYRIGWEHVYYNFMRMAYSHFSEDRIQRCKKLITYSNADHIESLVIEDGVLEQRHQYFSRRKYTDDWFMEKFNIPF